MTQNTFRTIQCQFWCRLFNATSRQCIWVIALGPQVGESTHHQEMFQCFCWWVRVWIPTLSQMQDAFSHSWSVSSSSRMLNRALSCFLHWFIRLQQGQYVRLLVRWFWRRYINLPWNLCTMQATIVSLFSAAEPPILSQYVRFNGLYTFFRWRLSQIACGGTWATRLTWMLWICFTCRLLDSMLEVIVAAISTNLMSLNSEFLFSELCKLVYNRCLKGLNS